MRLNSRQHLANVRRARCRLLEEDVIAGRLLCRRRPQPQNSRAGEHTGEKMASLHSGSLNIHAAVRQFEFDRVFFFPTISIIGNPSFAGAVARKLEQDMSTLTVFNPYTNQTEHVTAAMADPVEMGLLHMITADPARTPTFTMFGPGDYFFLSSGSITPTPGPGFAWSHGGIQPEIAQTFLGMVGPGVLHGATRTDDGSGIEFSDHTDIRPTIMALLGLQDDYTHDGRVLFEIVRPTALPHSLTAHYGTLLNLARVYKMINAPFGDLGRNSLTVSTAALASNTVNDGMYTTLEAKIASWRGQRDSVASQMKDLLEGAAFSEGAQAHLVMIRARAALVEARTKLVNSARGVTKYPPSAL